MRYSVLSNGMRAFLFLVKQELREGLFVSFLACVVRSGIHTHRFFRHLEKI